MGYYGNGAFTSPEDEQPWWPKLNLGYQAGSFGVYNLSGSAVLSAWF